MIAPPFAVWWESTDLSSFPSLYASGLASLLKISFGTTASILSNDTPPISPPSNTNPDKEKSALSPGAIAGIAVGVGAFVIIGIVFLLYIWRRRKQQRQRLQHRNEPEMEGSPGGFKSFMGEDWRAEADGTTGRVETDGTTGPVEVDEESRAVRAFPGPPVEMDGTQTARG
ncbi:hypothetical protein AA0118_g1449 [Alternaria tenuissima]|uniref:Mid2 domain-containing protein n=1 Tax=Alternaria tenuissima TaxID=119927 RepID=A0A4Q4M2V7_9PLEO|nr:hypothetical protein AA0114_g11853 [Alternaria tenuissima]RYN67846.1 hypothetical protein AA0118_g1449 [Alternaria tenuissima]